MTRTRTPVLAALLVLVAAGCSAGRSERPSVSDSPSSPPVSSSTSATPSAAPAPPAPERAACYQLTPPELTQPSNASATVRCTGRHTARTIFVGRLDTVVDGHSVAVDSSRVQRQLSTTCPRKLAAYVGGSPATRDLSRFNVVWYSPTLAQSDRGADWFRCDLIAFGDQQRLHPLPRKGGLRGVLGRPGALTAYGLCGTAAPGTPDFRRVICAEQHSWRAFATVKLAGGRRYPGAATVRRTGDDDCKGRARARSANTLRFRYGWEWPTRDQWSAGQHFGYCWVPA